MHMHSAQQMGTITKVAKEKITLKAERDAVRLQPKIMAKIAKRVWKAAQKGQDKIELDICMWFRSQQMMTLLLSNLSTELRERGFKVWSYCSKSRQRSRIDVDWYQKDDE